MAMEDYWTIRQAAEALQVHERTIRRWISTGRLSAVHIGGTVRVPRKAVEALADMPAAGGVAQETSRPAQQSIMEGDTSAKGQDERCAEEVVMSAKSTDSEKNGAAIPAGLQDVVAGESKICFIDGNKGRLLYRGYDVVELAQQSSFEEVAYLLWYGRLPGRIEFDVFLDMFTGSMELPVETVMILRMFPKAATPMEVLRTAISSLGHWDPDSGCTRLDACLRKAIRLTQRLPQLVAAHQRLRYGMEPVHPAPGKSIAYNFLYTLHGEEPPAEWVKAFDVALTLHVDHEWNASTFTARVIASTMADMYSGVTGAIGALKGPLHGGANEQVMRMLDAIGDPAKAEAWVKDALARKEKIPGFGHRVYRTDDPRAGVLKAYAESLSKSAGDTRLFDTAVEVERVARENTRVYPNVDFYSGICYHMMKIDPELFTPIFAISRVVGWTAHILEQWSNNRIIRPRADYIGPDNLHYVPITER